MISQELLPTYLTVYIYTYLHKRNCNACLLRVLLQLDYVHECTKYNFVKYISWK